jgi:hypothetical protein
MRIQFRKAIVINGNVECYYCIIWGSRAAFNQGLLPGFFYPFFQASDTANRQCLFFPQIIGSASYTYGTVIGGSTNIGGRSGC